MGSYDSTEVCELVGGFLLNRSSHVIDKHFVGLYRDEDLRVLENYSDPTPEKKQKWSIKVSKNYGIWITTETNIQIVNFSTPLPI